MWNPWEINASDPSYPKAPGSDHSHWKIGDLSGRHGVLKGHQEFKTTLTDYNLPLYGVNSIIGRSIVLLKTSGLPWACSTIQLEDEVITAIASFRKGVIGRVMFRQSLADPDNDLSVLVELSLASGITTNGHNWHVHEFPLQTVTESCVKAGGHFNPHKVPTVGNYSQDCGSSNPFLCEAGDYAGRHKAISFLAQAPVRYFFTDTSSSLTGPFSIIGKSLVVHGPEGSPIRLACANILLQRPAIGRTSIWFGPGDAQGQLSASQISDLDITSINIQFSGLSGRAGGFHIHELPVIAGSTNPCLNAFIKGHFNPFMVNISASPTEGQGTDDEYEVGDISGRHGSLMARDQISKQYRDTNFPLSGMNSIIMRSLVIHYSNGSRMQCCTVLPQPMPEGDRIDTRAIFTGNISGSVTMTQIVYPDGSASDTTILMELTATSGISSQDISLHWFIEEREGEPYNPYGIPNQAGPVSLCSPLNPLHCRVGDLTTKHGAITEWGKRLVTDPNMPLSGDFTVIGRVMAVQTDSVGRSEARIRPSVPVSSFLFPREIPFNKSAFRRGVSVALRVPFWKVTVFPESEDNGTSCLRMNFFVIGFNDSSALTSLQAQESLASFFRSPTCRPESVPSGIAGLGVLVFLPPLLPVFCLWMLS
ncbi:uncharacterized protein LOC128501147 [Spea bombifrons]|uniref:uncharacterized protein LOC128501147 n=1 Tax=Spea bombifrons TaxID=233779 RepID=UPI002349C2A2|nr:uncharacterized protein LOC128501147 [Spea bombifrons]